MKDIKEFNIPFVGLKEGSHLFTYQIDKKFFEAFQFDEFNDSNLTATINFVKKSTLFELCFTIKGTVNVPCDTTNEPFDLEIDGVLNLVVKFGPEYNDEHDEILILPHEVYQINVAQYIYELIVLSVPSRRVHPDVLNGTMKSDALQRLNELRINEEKTVEENSADPRWDKLKDLLTDK
ncbi:YceD family protein [Tenacibaculum aestuariivivum]|uniref:YceD family protein n=1 Tax=Tenacibaculum aestuariivivum TaxID=2006131 RepID=UPI003AB2319C